MLLKTTTGRASFASGSCAYHTFVMPSREFELPAPVHLGVMAKNERAGVTRQSSFKHNATNLMIDMGSFFETTYDVPEGMVIKLFGEFKTQPFGGSGYNRKIASALLRIRKDAALYRITCRAVDDPKATFQDIHIEGRFDVLSMQEAIRLGVGVEVQNSAQYTNRDNLAMMYRLQKLSPEIKSARIQSTTTVKADDGSSVVVPTSIRKRALDLD